MTNKYMYFIANWKMFGDIKSVKSIDKVIEFSKKQKKNKFKIIYSPPYTLLDKFFNKIKKTKIDICGQNCHSSLEAGPYTGSINSKMLRNIGAKFVILGHSENRKIHEDDSLINQKIKSSLKNNLKVILCIGENLNERKKKLTHKILLKQITKGLKNINKSNNILLAYEPTWSIGTGVIPKIDDLKKDIMFIKKNLNKMFKNDNVKILYGGSVNSNNILDLKKINDIDGFLIGGASQSPNKFIDIIKKTFN